MAAFVGLLIGIKFSDRRVVVEDAIVGRDFHIVSVDGREVERKKHGLFSTVVPLALIEPGERTFSLVPRSSTGVVHHANEDVIEFKATIFKVGRYALKRDEEGEPALVITKL